MAEDIRILTSLKGNRKRRRLKKLLGTGYLDYLIDLWITIRVDRPTGDISDWDAEEIADAAGYKSNFTKFVDALVASGFLDELPGGGYHPHNWEKHQGYAVGSEERSAQARLKANIRWAREHYNKQCTGQCTQQCFQQCQLQYIEQCKFHKNGNAPVPSPLPSPLPSPDPLLIPPKSPLTGGLDIPKRDRDGKRLNYDNAMICSECRQEFITSDWNVNVRTKHCRTCDTDTNFMTLAFFEYWISPEYAAEYAAGEITGIEPPETSTMMAVGHGDKTD